MKDPKKPRLQVVDDEPDICELVRQIAQQFGYDVHATAKPRDFQSDFEEFQPDVVVLDIVMPDMDGVEILKQLAAQENKPQVIMMTGYSGSYLSKAVDLGRGLGLQSVTGLLKPVSLSDLRSALGGPQDDTADPDNRSAAL